VRRHTRLHIEMLGSERVSQADLHVPALSTAVPLSERTITQSKALTGCHFYTLRYIGLAALQSSVKWIFQDTGNVNFPGHPGLKILASRADTPQSRYAGLKPKYPLSFVSLPWHTRTPTFTPTTDLLVITGVLKGITSFHFDCSQH